jgi:hypothetical protein
MKRFVEGTDRGQSTLFPECLEDWIGEDNPVPVIDVFVEIPRHALLDLSNSRIVSVTSQRELARLAKIHVSTLVRLESAGWKVAPGNATTAERVLDVLERKGVEFIEHGVRLVRRPRR